MGSGVSLGMVKTRQKLLLLLVRIMPIRSPRKTYEIKTITRNLDDHPDRIDSPTDELPGNTDESIFVKIKLGIGDYLGLDPIAWNDPRLLGTFKTDDVDAINPAQKGATNAGVTYHRNIGGFKQAAYTLIPVETFEIEEDFYDRASDKRVTAKKKFQSMTLGFPKGHKVWAFKYWLAAQENFETIRAFVTPAGKRINLN